MTRLRLTFTLAAACLSAVAVSAAAPAARASVSCTPSGGTDTVTLAPGDSATIERFGNFIRVNNTPCGDVSSVTAINVTGTPGDSLIFTGVTVHNTSGSPTAVHNDADLTINGAIGQSGTMGDITKDGAGTLTLGGRYGHRIRPGRVSNTRDAPSEHRLLAVARSLLVEVMVFDPLRPVGDRLETGPRPRGR